MNEIKCYYTLGAMNYKNGFVTSCPQQSDQLAVIENTVSIKPSDIINSADFKKHRLEMMNGTWSEGCHLCQEIEEAGAGKTMRDDYPADTTTYDPVTGGIDFKGLRHIELRFSNSCNFSCLHCSEVYSSGWMYKLKDYKADKEDLDNDLFQLTKVMHRLDDKDDLSMALTIEQMTEIVEDLNANFPLLEKIDFAGGEVLYQKQFFPCLELLSKHPNAANITICFHSNFNAKFDPARLYELLMPFGKTTIMMSIDAGQNIYKYFRTGDWEVLKSNIAMFKSLDNSKKIALNLVCTTSIYQMMDIENVMESFLTLDMDWINSSIVYTPHYLNPTLLMLDFEDHVRTDLAAARLVIDKEKEKRFEDLDQYTKLRSWSKGKQQFIDIESAYVALDNIEKYVYNAKSSRASFNSFLVYVRKSDMIWKQNFNDHFKKYQFIDNKIVRVAP